QRRRRRSSCSTSWNAAGSPAAPRATTSIRRNARCGVHRETLLEAEGSQFRRLV
ncbi:unnamed protein product, partial [Symbiodinium necroappetens]